ncbi:hypothetical protein VNO77_00703 [Canavalia gladiata]|uniref:Uncharacterized protein n=1 Tax=Canavalia gladiata TaxID=3824 RepID=A0AAN9MUI4_CANGL
MKVKKGWLAIQVEDESQDGEGTSQRFLIPISYLYHPLFKDLLDKAYEVYGYHPEGPLKLPCSVDDFLHLRWRIEKESTPHHYNHHQHHHHHLPHALYFHSCRALGHYVASLSLPKVVAKLDSEVVIHLAERGCLPSPMIVPTLLKRFPSSTKISFNWSSTAVMFVAVDESTLSKLIIESDSSTAIREANGVAEMLVENGLSADPGLQLFGTLPSWIYLHNVADSFGCLFPGEG